MFESLSPDRLSQVIAHAIAPAFVLGAVASFTGILSVRLSAIIDRIRVLNALPEGQDISFLRADLPRLKRRAELTNRAILYAVISGVISAALLIVAFVSAFLGIEHVYGAGIMFMIAMLFLVAALVVFACEVRIALTDYDHHNPAQN